MKIILIVLMVICVALAYWFFSLGFKPTDKVEYVPSGENVSGGYTIPNPCDERDCSIGK